MRGEWADKFRIDPDKFKWLGRMETPSSHERIEPIYEEVTEERAEELGTISANCVYCNRETLHKYRKGGNLWCLLCGKAMPEQEDLYCLYCKTSTRHYEFYDVWKCTVCGHTKSHGQADSYDC